MGRSVARSLIAVMAVAVALGTQVAPVDVGASELPSPALMFVLDVVEAPDGTLGALIVMADPFERRHRLGLMTVTTDLDVQIQMFSKLVDLFDWDLAYKTGVGWLVAYSDENYDARIARVGDGRIDEVVLPLGGALLFDDPIDPEYVHLTDLTRLESGVREMIIDLDESGLGLSNLRQVRAPEPLPEVRMMIDSLRLPDGTHVTLGVRFSLQAGDNSARLLLSSEGRFEREYRRADLDSDYYLLRHWGGFAMVWEQEDRLSVLPLPDASSHLTTDWRSFTDTSMLLSDGGGVLRSFRVSGGALQGTNLGASVMDWYTAPLDAAPPLGTEIVGARVHGETITAITADGSVIAETIETELGSWSRVAETSPTPEQVEYDGSATVGFGDPVTLPATGVTDMWAIDDNRALFAGGGGRPFAISTSCETTAFREVRASQGLVDATILSTTVRSDGTVIHHVSSSMPGTTHKIDEMVAYGPDGIDRTVTASGDEGTWVFGGARRNTSLKIVADSNGSRVTIVTDDSKRRADWRGAALDQSGNGDRPAVVRAVHDSVNGHYVYGIGGDVKLGGVVVVDDSDGRILFGRSGSTTPVVSADHISSTIAEARISGVDGRVYMSVHRIDADKKGRFINNAVAPSGNTDEVELVADGANGRYIVFSRAGTTVNIASVSVESNTGWDSIASLALPSGVEGPMRAVYDPEANSGLLAFMAGSDVTIFPFVVDGTPGTCNAEMSTVWPEPISGLEWDRDERLVVQGASILPTGRPGRRSGYWLLNGEGHIAAFGDAPDFGRLPRNDTTDLTAAPDGMGYWTLDTEGNVTALGAAVHHGDLRTAGGPTGAVALAATPSGDGYWIFAQTGAVSAFGDAAHLGDLAGLALSAPIIDAVALRDGTGYWMVAADGGVFSFGSAEFLGSVPQILPGVDLDAPVVGLVPAIDGTGYWLVASDGGVFTFNAPFVGSIPAVLPRGASLDGPIVGMVSYGTGYLLVGSDGGVFNFSDMPFDGSLGGLGLSGFVAIEPYRPS